MPAQLAEAKLLASDVMSSLQSKKATSCFPRPITPRDRHEGRKQSTTETQKKAAPAALKQVRLGWKGTKEPSQQRPGAARWPGLPVDTRPTP